MTLFYELLISPIESINFYLEMLNEEINEFTFFFAFFSLFCFVFPHWIDLIWFFYFLQLPSTVQCTSPTCLPPFRFLSTQSLCSVKSIYFIYQACSYAGYAGLWHIQQWGVFGCKYTLVKSPEVAPENGRKWQTCRQHPGGTPIKIGRGVRPASQNPYPIYDQNLPFSLPFLWPDQKFDTLFMTWLLNLHLVSDLL